MPLFTTLSPEISDYPILYRTMRHNYWVSVDGEVCTPSNNELNEMLNINNPPLICHRYWTEKKIGRKLHACLDILELFAFTNPAEFCLPNPSGLAQATGLALAKTDIDNTILLRSVAYNLLDKLAEVAQDKSEKPPSALPANVGDIAEMMGQGGWLWAVLILPIFGKNYIKKAPPESTAAAIWTKLSETQEIAPKGTQGVNPVLPHMATNRLEEMLGLNSEIRKSQKDYAATSCVIFNQPKSESDPIILLSEAGTGIGKTVGYLAPASIWAETNDSSVWISTYTRTLQHQIADEVRRLPEKQNNINSNHSQKSGVQKLRRVVIRKGRENYLCLLNLEEALSTMPGRPSSAIALGLMARWASASEDGDLTGESFPA